MPHLHPSDKGWLRQYMPDATVFQQERFSRQVMMALPSPNPTTKQIEAARMTAYRSMTGAVA